MPDNVPSVFQEPWLDKAKTAEHFSCSIRSIELAMARGLPHATIFGRPKLKASQVEAWLDAHGEITLHGDQPDRRAA